MKFRVKFMKFRAGLRPAETSLHYAPVGFAAAVEAVGLGAPAQAAKAAAIAVDPAEFGSATSLLIDAAETALAKAVAAAELAELAALAETAAAVGAVAAQSIDAVEPLALVGAAGATLTAAAAAAVVSAAELTEGLLVLSCTHRPLMRGGKHMAVGGARAHRIRRSPGPAPPPNA